MEKEPFRKIIHEEILAALTQFWASEAHINEMRVFEPDRIEVSGVCRRCGKAIDIPMGEVHRSFHCPRCNQLYHLLRGK